MAVRRDLPIMQRGAIGDLFAMQQIGESVAFTVERIGGDDLAHVSKVPFIFRYVH